MEKCKVLIPVGCRSDEGLSKPIIKRLKEDDFFNPVHVCNLIPGNFFNAYFEIQSSYMNGQQFDLVFITGDRIEMTAAACWAFHNNIPIAHYFAGVLNYPLATMDDINRHCISLWSEIQFTESLRCAENLHELFNSINKKSNNHIVGITHMEDIEIDISLIPNEEYDLFLLNPTTLRNDSKIKWDYKDRKRIIIGSNPDPKPIEWKIISTDRYYDNLPRSQFLGLLKNCKRFITNSSSAIYEAPSFLDKDHIITIGDRNKNRTQFEYKKTDKLASEKIVETLKNWWRDKQND
jgi:UDP-N-acetylglucosamine 2-epimerase